MPIIQSIVRVSAKFVHSIRTRMKGIRNWSCEHRQLTREIVTDIISAGNIISFDPQFVPSSGKRNVPWKYNTKKNWNIYRQHYFICVYSLYFAICFLFSFSFYILETIRCDMKWCFKKRAKWNFHCWHIRTIWNEFQHVHKGLLTFDDEIACYTKFEMHLTYWWHHIVKLFSLSLSTTSNF